MAEAMDEWTRFRQVSRAFARSTGTYLTGWSAAVELKLPTLGKPPSAPTTIRPKSSKGHRARSGRGRIVVAELPIEHRFHKGPLLLASLPWATVDLARTARLSDALVVADRALRRGADLAAVLPRMTRWPGIRRAAWIVENADPHAESPLETLGRFAFIEYGLPMPVSNAWVGRDGPERRVDGLLPWHWWALEGDGALKYDDRPDASQIVRDQYEREFRLRREGLDFLRYGWPDVYPSREPLAAKAGAMFQDHRARPQCGGGRTCLADARSSRSLRTGHRPTPWASCCRPGGSSSGTDSGTSSGQAVLT